MKPRRPRPPGRPPQGSAPRATAPRPTAPRPGTPGPSPARPGTADEEVTFGLRAGLALVARRPADVSRVAFAPALRAELGELFQASQARRFPASPASDAELARVAGSTHHEGLVVVARPRAWASGAELAERLVRAGGVAVALDRVRNPYNVGAILRTAAFFGVDAALLGAIAPRSAPRASEALAADAVRVAEGGAEHLALSRTTDLAATLERLRAQGVQVVGADGAARTSAIGFPFRRPAVLVMGHEREGISPRVRAQCDALVAIPGTGAIESLNVAVAAGLLVGELVRDRLASPATK